MTRHDIGMSGIWVLYRLYDADGSLLYIGVTDRFNSRMKVHKCVAGWWHLVVRTEVEYLHSHEEAAQAELDAIFAESPLCNSDTKRYARQPAGASIDLDADPAFVTVAEFAAATGMHYLTALKSVKQGLIVSHRFGGPRGRFRIPVTELERHRAPVQQAG